MQIVTLHNNTLETSHLVIAEYSANNPHSVSRIIRTHIKDFEDFGLVRIEESNNSNFNAKKTYFLNEQQATLLMTYLKNTEIVRNFKKTLIKAFYELKNANQLPHANNDGVIEALKLKITQLQNVVMAQNTLIANNPTPSDFEDENKKLRQELEIYKYPVIQKKNYTLDERIEMLVFEAEKICAGYKHDEKNILSFYNQQTRMFAQMVKEYKGNPDKHLQDEIESLKLTLVKIHNRYHTILTTCSPLLIQDELRKMTNLFQMISSGDEGYNLNTKTIAGHGYWGDMKNDR